MMMSVISVSLHPLEPSRLLEEYQLRDTICTDPDDRILPKLVPQMDSCLGRKWWILLCANQPNQEWKVCWADHRPYWYQDEFLEIYKALNLTKEEVRLAVEKATSAEGLYASLVAEDYSV